MKRRRFIQAGVGAAAFLAARRKALGYAVSMRVTKFNTPLRRFGVEIPIATPDQATYPGIDYYEIEAGAFRDPLHPDLYVGTASTGTRLYGYRQTNGVGTAYKHLGAAIVAKKDVPVRIKFSCALPAQHILPFDSTIPQGPMGTPLRQDAAAIHLHGGLVPWPSDGGPFHWISTSGAVGASLIGTEWLPAADGVTLTNDYLYPNHQSARLMWYHDHAIGITRTNAYAGIATGYILYDNAELAMAGAGLPFPGDILVFQDKVFWDPAIDPNYLQYAGPTSLGGALQGDLWYPYIYDPKIWGLMKGGVPPIPSAVAEMFGDTMLVNGTPYPYMNVAGRHRLRLLNACNGRFLNLSFAVENPYNLGEPKIGAKGLPQLAPVTVWQIGTEGGFLPAPVLLVNNGVAVAPLLLAPAERADLIVDFTNAAGTGIILYNDAGAPFPGGSPLFDFSTQTNNAKTGFGPNTRTLMQFRVGAGGSAFPLPNLAGANPVLSTVADTVNGGLKLAAAPGSVVNHGGVGYNYLATTQELTLNEAVDPYGRLAQVIGNVNNPNGVFGSPYWDGPGEQVGYRTIQIWNIYNPSADTHPMHFHLFNVMVLRRRPFNVKKFTGVPVWTGPGRGPDPGEEGWKETVKMNPGECTTVAVLVEDPFVLPGPASGVHGSDRATRQYTIVAGGAQRVATVPYSPRLANFGRTADEYVWHCHILEHEEHDMMHSLEAS